MIDFSVGISAFLDNYLKVKERRREAFNKDKRQMISDFINKQSLVTRELSCKFCAAPLESTRCEYCGRLSERK